MASAGVQKTTNAPTRSLSSFIVMLNIGSFGTGLLHSRKSNAACVRWRAHRHRLRSTQHLYSLLYRDKHALAVGTATQPLPCPSGDANNHKNYTPVHSTFLTLSQNSRWSPPETVGSSCPILPLLWEANGLRGRWLKVSFITPLVYGARVHNNTHTHSILCLSDVVYHPAPGGNNKRAPASSVAACRINASKHKARVVTDTLFISIFSYEKTFFIYEHSVVCVC